MWSEPLTTEHMSNTQPHRIKAASKVLYHIHLPPLCSLCFTLWGHMPLIMSFPITHSGYRGSGLRPLLILLIEYEMRGWDRLPSGGVWLLDICSFSVRIQAFQRFHGCTAAVCLYVTWFTSGQHVTGHSGSLHHHIHTWKCDTCSRHWAAIQ